MPPDGAPVILLHNVQLLRGEGHSPERADVLLQGSSLALMAAAGSRQPGPAEQLVDAGGWLLAPCLTDPHSRLDDPCAGVADDLQRLARTAIRGGYGTVGLLPNARPWRDRPEQFALQWPEPLELLLWGGFSRRGEGQLFSDHEALLEAGACGLSEGEDCPSASLMMQGLRLLSSRPRPVPLALAPLRRSLDQGGWVREGVDGLRNGLPLDPPASELLPLMELLTAQTQLQPASATSLRLLNMSTAPGVALLQAHRPTVQASVHWWQLVADSSSISQPWDSWRIRPSLGTPADREALIAAAAAGVITAAAVHHRAIDGEDQLLPTAERPVGLAGYAQVLPLLWDQLLNQRSWSLHQLWSLLSFGPRRFLGMDPETLEPGTRRWLLFDPDATWRLTAAALGTDAGNLPLRGTTLRGRVIATGLAATPWIPLSCGN